MMAAAPTLDGNQIEQALFDSSVDLGAPGRDPLFGYGRVEANAGVKAALARVVAVDRQPPTAAITSPAANVSVSGLVTVNVAAGDNVGVDRVELKTNGTVVGSDSASPFSFSWNSANAANGMTILIATAFDKAGNFTASLDHPLVRESLIDAIASKPEKLQAAIRKALDFVSSRLRSKTFVEIMTAPA